MSKGKRLTRQRMDFLLLIPRNQRIVIEIDGKQHYSDNEGRANPNQYSEMVAEDRKLKLSGYELYRFGGYELVQANASIVIEDFFKSYSVNTKFIKSFDRVSLLRATLIYLG